jgi:protein-glutamine gamma-glutamyltransferase
MGVQKEVPAQRPPTQPVTRPIEQFFQVSLLGLLASGFLALVFSTYLDTPTIVLTTTGLLARAAALSSRGARWQLPSPIANALTLAYIGFYPLDYMYLSREFIPAAVHLICFLAVVRILSARTNRDYFFVKVIAFLELLAATLLSSNISFFVFLILFVIFGVATFCCSEIRRSSQQPRRIAATRLNFHGRLAAATGVITLGIVLMTAGLFIILPRTARAAFRSLVPEKYHITGFANEISLGQIGRIQQSTRPLIHIKIEGVFRHLPLKWRGGALTQFDGKRWYNPLGHGQAIAVDDGMVVVADDDQRRRVDGRRLQYQVRIDSIDTDALFFAGIPEVVHINTSRLIRTPEGALRTGSRMGIAKQYYAASFLPQTGSATYTPRPLAPEAVIEHLLLPDIDRRIVDLARSLDSAGSIRDRSRGIENYLRTNFTYTTDLLDNEVKDPLAHFLFQRKAGHCEYFASALAVMLRANHIPTRVVTGFQSGVYNPMTGWQVLRASDAHSWVEAWSPAEGWITLDPTPPSNAPQGKPWAALALYMDTAEMWWQRWVIDYDLEHQIYLASRFEQSARAWNSVSSETWLTAVTGSVKASAVTAWEFAPFVGVALIAIALARLLTPIGIRAYRRIRHARKIREGGAGASDAAILYMQMLEVLRKRGYEKPAWLTPNEFARVIPESPTAALVSEFTALYQDLRYGGRASAGERMLGLLQEIETVSAAGSAK